MTRIRLLAFALLSTACSESAPPLDIPRLHDVERATAAIESAARSVVRIRTSGGTGTGAFISESGLLLTNDHVLGTLVCPREGCWVELAFQHQRGEAWTEDQLVYAVPQHVDVAVDMAVLQIFHADQPSEPLDTSDFLRLHERSSAELVGEHITIVGHPLGRLKKWSDGRVLEANGIWFTADNFILPGSSGSPVLDDKGQLVGLIHRAQSGDGLFTDHGVNTLSTGSASNVVKRVLTEPLPDTVRSIATDVTREEAILHNLVYLNARSQVAVVDGVDTELVTLLGEACDAGLAREDITSYDDLNAALAPCYDAQSWIECRASDDPRAYGVCPERATRALWAERYRALDARWRKFNGTGDRSSVTWGIASLADDQLNGQQDAADELVAYIRASKTPLDFRLTPYTAAFEVQVAETIALAEAYADQPDYRTYAIEIANTLAWLMNKRQVSLERGMGINNSLMQDGRVTVGARLYLEELAYNWEQL